MMHHEEHDAPNEWSTEERSRLANLSMEREPSALLRPRTVAALRDAGLLASADVAAGDVKVRRLRSVGRGLALAAAASLLLVAGGAVGYGVAVRRFTARPNADAVRIATEVVPAATTAPATDRHVVWF